MHVVNWNSQRFESIAKAATQPGGLAVLGILFKVGCSTFMFPPFFNKGYNLRDLFLAISLSIP